MIAALIRWLTKPDPSTRTIILGNGWSDETPRARAIRLARALQAKDSSR